MEKYKFNLQLFAEAGEVEVDSAGQTDSADNNIQSDATGSGGDESTSVTDSMGVVVDRKTGKRTVELISQQEDKLENQEQKSSPEIKPYTPQELIAAAQMGTVDENRVPDEFRLQYETYKQQLLRQQSGQQAQPEQTGQDTQHLSQNGEKPQPKEVYAALAKTALENTLTELGMSKEDYDMLSYNDDPSVKTMFETAYQANIQRLIAYSQQVQLQEQSRLLERKAVYDDVNSFINTAKQNEPNFGAIDKLMATRYKTLAFEQAEKVARAISDLQQGIINRNQLPILESYYKETREAYYAQQNGLSTTPVKKNPAKPPVVESGGNGASVPEEIDFSKMRFMSRKEKENLLEKYFTQRVH